MTTSGVIDRQPDNLNELNPSAFELRFNKMPNVEFFCQSFNMPSISLTEVLTPTPNISLPQPGDSIFFAPFDITFIVDEDLNNYIELYDWFVGLGFPNTTNEFKTIRESNTNLNPNSGEFSDAKLIVMSNKMNPIVEISFGNCFPITMGSLPFSTTTSDVSPLIVDASFQFQGAFKIERVV